MSLAALYALSSLPGLIQATTPTAERQRILERFFEPRPGQELTVSERSIALQRGQDQLLIRGEFWIRPPKGHCLIIRGDPKKRDQKVCTDRLWSWDLFDLDAVGRYHLTVVAGPSDEGTPLSWPTPYRLANYVPFSADDLEEHFDVPIKRCRAETVEGERKITLELFDERRWFIYLPDFDAPVVPEQEPPPNLIVRIDSKKEPPPDPSKAKDKDAKEGAAGQEQGDAADKPAEKDKGKAPAPEEAAENGGKKRRSVLSQLLSGDYKNVKKETYGFRVPKRDAFEMPSSRFMETSVPQGMNGVCRYKFQGAPGDPRNGVIECYDTDAFRSVYAVVSCFSQFSPQLDPRAPRAKAAAAKGAAE